MKPFFSTKRFLFTVYLLSLLLTGCSGNKQESKWYRGNMHTHSFWSDGNDFPENVAQWYKDHGYDFLAVTDHNLIQEGERWRSFPAKHPALEKYLATFGRDWVEMRHDDQEEGVVNVRLKPFEEYRSLVEEPEAFLLIRGNDVSNPHAIHLLAFHQEKVIPVVEGTVEDRAKMISETVNNLREYREQTGIKAFPVLAHPNFTWAVTAEMMMAVPSLRFFEVFNGHPSVHNAGDEYRVSTGRIWDIVLSHRLRNDGKLLYGLATDDAHHYHGGGAGPGKGWIMVRADTLRPGAILDALDKGDFYASTGVELNTIEFNGEKLKIEINPKGNEQYVTEFIGTRKGFDPVSIPTTDAAGNNIENTTGTYSPQIGQIFKSSNFLSPSYSFQGDELYVRVRITSTADHIDPVSGKKLGKQRAWVQPCIQED